MRYQHDARYQGIVKVHYPFHPLFGGEFRVVRSYVLGGVFHFEVEVESGRQALPGWMTEEVVCVSMTGGDAPVCSLTSLLRLRRLVRGSGL